MSSELSAILIAPDGPDGTLRTLMDRLQSVGVTSTIVDELAAAVELAARHEAPPAILLDLRDAAAGEVEDLKKVVDVLRRTLAALPGYLPIVITACAAAPLIIQCMRMGAADVLDLTLEGTATARASVMRVCAKQANRRHELDVVDQQRQMIEDLLKDLIRTERRSIDNEEKLLAQRRHTTGEQSVGENRPPAVLLVEHDREVADELADLLEAAGVATYAYVTGEEALREVETLAASPGLDIEHARVSRDLGRGCRPRRTCSRPRCRRIRAETARRRRRDRRAAGAAGPRCSDPHARDRVPAPDQGATRTRAREVPSIASQVITT
jgi:CheY-like chemotaxis protein